MKNYEITNLIFYKFFRNYDTIKNDEIWKEIPNKLCKEFLDYTLVLCDNKPPSVIEVKSSHTSTRMSAAPAQSNPVPAQVANRPNPAPVAAPAANANAAGRADLARLIVIPAADVRNIRQA